MTSHVDQALHTLLSGLSIPEGWAALGSMVDLMVSRTPGQDSNFYDWFTRVRGISAGILTPEATPTPFNQSTRQDQDKYISSSSSEYQDLQNNDQSQPPNATDNHSQSTAVDPSNDQSQAATEEPFDDRSRSATEEPSDNHQPPNAADDHSRSTAVDPSNDQSQAATEEPSDNQSQSDTEDPPPGPRKYPPDFREERFAKLPYSIKKESQPNPAKLLKKTWEWYRALRGTRRWQHQINPSDPWRRRLGQLLDNDYNDGEDLAAIDLRDITRMRYHAFLFTREYEHNRKLMMEEDERKRARRNKKSTQPSKPLQRPKRNRALDELIRECWSLPPTCKIASDSPRKTRAKYWIGIGLPILELYERIGYVAFLAPGLLLTQDSLGSLKRHQAKDFADYVKLCYRDFEQELTKIEPIVKSLMRFGPDRQLFLETITEEQLPEISNFSLENWFAYVLLLDWEVPYQAPVEDSRVDAQNSAGRQPHLTEQNSVSQISAVLQPHLIDQNRVIPQISAEMQSHLIERNGAIPQNSAGLQPQLVEGDVVDPDGDIQWAPIEITDALEGWSESQGEDYAFTCDSTGDTSSRFGNSQVVGGET